VAGGRIARRNRWGIAATGAGLIVVVALVVLLRRDNELGRPQSDVASSDPAKSGTPSGITVRPGPPSTPRIQFNGHTSSVRAISFRPDGRVLASGGADATIRVWDFRTGGLLSTQSNTTSTPSGGSITHEVLLAAFSPDGKHLATNGGGPFSGQHAVRIWNGHTGRLLRSLGQSVAIPDAITFVEHGKVLITFHVGGLTPEGKRAQEKGGTLVRWDPQEATELGRTYVETAQSFPTFSPDGRFLAFAAAGGAVKLYNLQTGAVLRDVHRAIEETRRGPETAIRSLAFSPDGEWLAVGESTGRVSIYETAANRVLHVLNCGAESVRYLAFDSAHWRLATASQSRQGGATNVRVWDLERRCVRKQFAVGFVHAMAFAPDGTSLAVAGSKPGLTLWDAALEPLIIDQPEHQSSWRGPNSLALLPETDRVIVGGLAGLGTWDFREGKPVATSRTQATVPKVTVSADGQVMAVVESPMLQLLVRETNTGRELAQLDLTALRDPDEASPGKPNLQRIAFRARTSQIVVGTGGRAVLWDYRTGERFWPGPKAPVLPGPFGMAVSPDGRLLLTGTWERETRFSLLTLWDLNTGEPTRELGRQVHYLTGAVFSPDSRRLLTGGGGIIQLWDVETGHEIRRFSSQGVPVSFAPDGEHAASLHPSWIGLWDLERGDEYARIQRGPFLRDLVFSGDGRHLVTIADGQAEGIAVWPTLLTGVEDEH
jgi:WD40 repeat protein